MVDLLFTVDGYVKWMYLLVLLASLYFYRAANSFVIASLIITATEFIMYFARGTFLKFAQTFEHDYAVAIWALGWMVFDFLVILSIRLTHVRLKLNTSKAAYFVTTSLLALMVLQFIRYVDDQVLTTTFIPDIYRFGIPSINICIALVLSYILVSECLRDSGFYRRYFND